MVRRITAARGQFDRKNVNPRSINSITTAYKEFVGLVEADMLDIMQHAADMQLAATIPFVPVDTQALVQSGRAKAERNSRGVVAIVSFGGENAPVTPTKNAPDGIVRYAAIVNYDMSLKHETGEAMFLEKGASASRTDVDNYIKDRLRNIK